MMVIRVCRMCLVTNVTMFQIHGSYEHKVYNILGQTKINEPYFACFECYFLLKKFIDFRDKSVRAHTILLKLIQENYKVTENVLRGIDRNVLNLDSNIKPYPVTECVSIDPDTDGNDLLDDIEAESAVPPLENENDNERTIIKDDNSTGKRDPRHEKDKSTAKSFNKKRQIYTDLKTAVVCVPRIDVNEILTGYVAKDKEHQDSVPRISSQDILSKKKISQAKRISKVISTINKKRKTRIKNSLILKNNMRVTVKDLININSKMHNSGSKTKADEKAVQAAVKAVKAGLMKSEAMKKYGVNKSTLTARLKKLEGYNSDESKLSQIHRGRKTEIKKIKVRQDAIKEYSKDFEIKDLTLEEQIAELEKRKETANYKMSAYKCEYCYKGFSDSKVYERHARIHHESSGPLSCHVCHARFPSSNERGQHVRRHATLLRCKRCPFQCHVWDEAKRHRMWHDGVRYPCKTCGMSFTKITTLFSHERIKHRSDHVCDVCGHSFVSYMGMHMHKRLIHYNVQSEKKEGETKEDVKKNTTSSELYCSVCDIQFLSMDAFNRHGALSAKHTDSAAVEFPCLSCGRSFRTTHERRAHAASRPACAPPPRTPAAKRTPTM